MKTANEYLSREALISKLEAAQQQLAEAQAKLARSELTLDYVREEWKNDTAVADLRKQLAEAREIELRYLGQVGSLEKQLAEAQAEVERLEALPRDVINLLEDKVEPRVCTICGVAYVDGKHP